MQAAVRLGLPLELVQEAEGFQQDGEEWFADNLQTIRVFIDMSTQWRIGMSGAVGLDYNVLFSRLDRLFGESDEWEEVFGGIKIMERAALEVINKKG